MMEPCWSSSPGGEAIVGALQVRGLELTGRSGSIKAIIPDGYGETGFQSTALGFPPEGCWEITGRAGGAELTFVTRVQIGGPKRESDG